MPEEERKAAGVSAGKARSEKNKEINFDARKTEEKQREISKTYGVQNLRIMR